MGFRFLRHMLIHSHILNSVVQLSIEVSESFHLLLYFEPASSEDSGEIEQMCSFSLVFGGCLYNNICRDKQNEHKIVNIYLSIDFNMCFGCSKEPSHLRRFF